MELQPGVVRKLGVLWTADRWRYSFLPEDWNEIKLIANDTITQHYVSDYKHYGPEIAESRAKENSRDLWRYYRMYGIDRAVEMLDQSRLPFLPFEAPAEVEYE